MLRIDHYLHFADDTLKRGLGAIINQGARIMTKLDDLIAAQTETAATLTTMAGDITEIGTDLDALIAAVGSADDQAKLDAALTSATELRDRVNGLAGALRGEADKFTPTA